MKKKILLTLSLFLFIFTLAACTTDEEEPEEENGQEESINGETDDSDTDDSDVEDSDEAELSDIPTTAVEADDFDVLVAALSEADLVSALEAEGPFTVFAPTDQAFGELLEALDVSQEELLTRDDLSDILLYHVLDGAFSAEDVIDLTSDGSVSVETLSGEEVTLSVSDGNVFVNGVQVITADIETSNGVIHVIEEVLLPEEDEDALIEFTLEELSNYDGQEGRDAYIAVDGYVYDVTESSLWTDGSHQGSVTAGADLSEALDNNPQHGREMLDRIPKIGILVSEEV